MVKSQLKRVVVDIGGRMPQRLVDSLNNLTSYVELGQQAHRRRFGRPQQFRSRDDLFDFAIARIGGRQLLYLEFGVFQGDTTRFWAARVKTPEARFHGFDSFEGLPTTWNAAYPKGRFSTGGAIPIVNDARVEFIRG